MSERINLAELRDATEHRPPHMPADIHREWVLALIDAVEAAERVSHLGDYIPVQRVQGGGNLRMPDTVFAIQPDYLQLLDAALDRFDFS